MENRFNQEIEITVSGGILKARLFIPENAAAVIVFAFGSGSSSYSPCNKKIMAGIQDNGYATLFLDLLTENENLNHANRFDIDLISSRLLGVTRWLTSNEFIAELPVGYFAEGTGTAAAIIASTELHDVVFAIVSRNGRPELAGKALNKLRVPLMLLAQSNDELGLQINELAFKRIGTVKQMEIIQLKTRLFESPEKLQEIIDHATGWFEKNLAIETITKSLEQN